MAGCSSGGCPDDCSGHGVCGLGELCGYFRLDGAACAEKACGDGCLHGRCVEDDDGGPAGASDRFPASVGWCACAKTAGAAIRAT